MAKYLTRNILVTMRDRGMFSMDRSGLYIVILLV